MHNGNYFEIQTVGIIYLTAHTVYGNNRTKRLYFGIVLKVTNNRET